MAPLRVTLFLAVLLGTLVPCHGHKFVHPLSLISFHKATVKLGESATLNLASLSFSSHAAFVPDKVPYKSAFVLNTYCSARPRSSPDDSITLTASPDLLATSGSWVNVTYKGVENPKKEDVVAVYSPTPDRPSLDPRRSAPIKFIVGWERSICTTCACLLVSCSQTTSSPL